MKMPERSNLDYLEDLDDKKTTSIFLFMFRQRYVSWSFKKQDTYCSC